MKAVMAQRGSIPELIEEAKRGDRRAFEEVMARCQEKLESFIRARIRPELRGRIAVESLANDTFARAFESLEKFAGTDADSWFGWLAGIAKKVVLKEIEQLSRSRAFQLDPAAPAEAASPSRVMRRDERLERLRESLEALSEDHREVIRLCRLKGLAIGEVAARMNRSPEAVKMLLSRALEQLKERFGDTESLHLPEGGIDMEGESDGR